VTSSARLTDIFAAATVVGAGVSIYFTLTRFGGSNNRAETAPAVAVSFGLGNIAVRGSF
jgi:hypothetical protein